MSKTAAVLTQRFGKFILLTLLPMAPLLLLTLGVLSDKGSPTGIIVAGLLTAIVTFVLTMAAQATSLYGAFQEMRGQPFTIGESLRVGFARVLPVIGVAILGGIAMVLGAMLLLVPGIIVACMLYVAVPVCVIEKKGVIESMSRSAALSKGYRWQIFGLILLVAVITLAGGSVLTRISGPGPFGLILEFLWQVVLAAFSAVLAAVIYHDLRMAKEGIDLHTLANVFD